MKIKLLNVAAFMALFLTAIPASSQTSKHEIRATIGLGVDAEVNDVREDLKNEFGLENSRNRGLKSVQGSYSLEYFYHPNKYWAIGVNFGIAESSGAGIRRSYDTTCNSSFSDGESADAVPRLIGGFIYAFMPYSEINIKSKSQFFLPSVKYSWISKEHFCLYSKLGLGAQHYKIDITSGSNDYASLDRYIEKVKFAYQLSALGIEFGGERLRASIDFGYGKQGIVNAGLVVNL